MTYKYNENVYLPARSRRSELTSWHHEEDVKKFESIDSKLFNNGPNIEPQIPETSHIDTIIPSNSYEKVIRRRKI